MGSIELIVWLLSKELSQMGHQVTIFATGDSRTAGELQAAVPSPCGNPGTFEDWQLCEWLNIGRALENARNFDIIHSHAYLWAMPVQSLSSCPVVHTLHTSPQRDSIRLWSAYPKSIVTALSAYQWNSVPHLTPASVIHHGIDTGAFIPTPVSQNYVCYLGRFTPGKGVLHAIRTASRIGMKLLIAGPHNAYFKELVQPLINGDSVQYVGPVRGRSKHELLGGASALLYPIRAEEPFGLVMIEAMMCGTPVAAVRMGAVTEIIDEGVTGYSVDSLDDFDECVRQTLLLDRCAVRARAVERFASSRMAESYLRVYEIATGPYWREGARSQ